MGQRARMAERHLGSFRCLRLDYLRTHVSVKDRVKFPLHELFQSFDPRSGTPTGSKVLEVGCGPVIQHGISVAAFASEIVFSDISSSNREAVQKINGWTETPTPSTGRLISTTSSRLSRERARRRPGRESSE